MIKGQKMPEEQKRKISESLMNHYVSLETRKKQSAIKKGRPGRRDDNCPTWKGGGWHYSHIKARVLFGKKHCDLCGINLIVYEHRNKWKKNFEMHCVNKDFRLLKKENWECLCASCHSKRHNGNYVEVVYGDKNRE